MTTKRDILTVCWYWGKDLKFQSVRIEGPAVSEADIKKKLEAKGYQVTKILAWVNSEGKLFTGRLERPCVNGTLCAEAAVDPEHPGLSLFLERPDGTQLDLVMVEGDSKDGPVTHGRGIHAYLYGDTRSDDWTRKYLYTEDELRIGMKEEEEHE